mgnify:CR=1 FL=1
MRPSYNRLKNRKGDGILRALIMVISLVFIAGCGIIDEVNQTVDYGKETKDYVGTMVGYQDDVSTYMNKDQLTEQDLQDIKGLIDEIEAEVKAFNEIEPPSVASGIHGEIESHNDQILEAIDEANRQMDQGEFNPEAFENLEIAKSLSELKSYKDQIDEIMN